jgi:glutamate carboxypeptidase
VNPGIIRGGTRTNVVPESAAVEVDIRVEKSIDALELDRRFRELKPFDKLCQISVSGGLNRPPMERTEKNLELFALARSLGVELGLNLQETSVGGGSDGNFTSALGIPTLDGLGAAGEGAHAVNESILISELAPRTALLARLIQSA